MDSEDDPKLVAPQLVTALKKVSPRQADREEADQGLAPSPATTNGAKALQAGMDDDDNPKIVARRLVAAIKDDDLDEADRLYEILCKFLPEEDMFTFKVFLMIQRGLAVEALQLINEFPEDTCPELKAVCLNLLNDPTWHSVAESLVDSPDPVVRKAMRQMLERPVEETA
jgi:hypothetical protein